MKTENVTGVLKYHGT